MTVADPLFAQWLQRESDDVVVTDAAALARWGATARTTTRVTGIATAVAARAQAERELEFWSRGPFAIDVHQVSGSDWASQLGCVVTLTIDSLGYGAGRDVFVFEVEADRASGLTSLTVLCPLGDAS